MERKTISSGGLVLDYLRFGGGPRILICFHGFGRRAEDFLYFWEELEKYYTVYSFHFFHHGKSEFPGDRIEKYPLRPEELTSLFETFLKTEGIRRFSLMGYSMGGKICLSLMHDLYPMVDELFLMAPDGIKTNFWYRFTSNNLIGNFLYRKILINPNPLFSVMKFLTKIRLMSEKLFRFAKGNLDTREKRELVYKVWMTLRKIEPSAKKSALIIRENSIQCSLLYGRFDKVILAKTGKAFAVKAGDSAHFHEIECGHNMFNENSTAMLAEILRKSHKKS